MTAAATRRRWTAPVAPVPVALAILIAVAVAVGAAPACRCADHPPAPEQYDASRQRRVFEPPPGEVRAVPPHAIHAGGVGPYLLGMPLKDVLEQLPHGPRVVLLQIDGVLDYSLVRAESDGLLIGVERPRGVTFLSVVDPELARTESGVGVGADRASLATLGKPYADPSWAADPRLVRVDTLPDARFVIEDDAVSAVLVQRADRFTPPGPEPRAAGSRPATVPAPPAPAPVPAPPGLGAGGAGGAGGPGGASGPGGPGPAAALGCPVPAIDDAEVIAAARLDPGTVAAGVVAACLSGGQTDVIVYTDARLVWVVGEPGKWRRVGWLAIPEIVYAAPIDLERDGRSELAVVTQNEGDGFRTVRLELLRIDQGKLQRATAEGDILYRVSESSVTGTGARMAEIDLLIELDAYADGIWASGVYLQRGRDGPRTVAPLLPVNIPARRKKASVPASPGAAGSGRAAHDAGPDADAGPDIILPDADDAD